MGFGRVLDSSADPGALAAGENHALHGDRVVNSRYCAICASENSRMFSPAE